MHANILNIQIDPHHICSFSCSYCSVHGQGKLQNKYSYPMMFDNHSPEEWISKFAEIPKELCFYFSGIGEPVLGPRFLEFIRLLDALPNVLNIVIYTNAGKKSLELIQQYHSLKKILFYASFHPEQISLEDFKKNISSIAQNNILARVSIVASQIEDTHLKNKLCDLQKEFMSIGINWFQVQADLFKLNADTYQIYHDILSDFRLDVELPYALNKKNTIGALCNAGVSYIYITSNGNIYRCQAGRNLQKWQLGNIFEKKTFRRFPTICPWTTCTTCVQEIGIIHGNGVGFNAFGVYRNQDDLRITTKIRVAIIKYIYLNLLPVSQIAHFLYKISVRLRNLKKK